MQTLQPSEMHARSVELRMLLTQQTHRRRGASSLDFVLILGIIMPLAAFMMWVAPRIMNLVYEMTSVLVSWPFLSLS